VENQGSMEWVTGQNSYGLRAGLEAVKRLLSSPKKKPICRCPLANLSRQTRNGNIINANYQQIKSSILADCACVLLCGNPNPQAIFKSIYMQQSIFFVQIVNPCPETKNGNPSLSPKPRPASQTKTQKFVHNFQSRHHEDRSTKYKRGGMRWGDAVRPL